MRSVTHTTALQIPVIQTLGTRQNICISVKTIFGFNMPLREAESGKTHKKINWTVRQSYAEDLTAMTFIAHFLE